MICVRDFFRSDDYMVKPVNVNEMVLRVELLRRAQILNEHKIVIGLKAGFDYDAMTVTRRQF